MTIYIECDTGFIIKNKCVKDCSECDENYRKKEVKDFIQKIKKDKDKYYKISDCVYIDKKSYSAHMPYVPLDTEEENVFKKYFRHFNIDFKLYENRSRYIYTNNKPSKFVEDILSVYTEKMNAEDVLSEVYHINSFTFLSDNSGRYKNDDLEYVLLNNIDIYKVNYEIFKEYTDILTNKIYDFLDDLNYKTIIINY